MTARSLSCLAPFAALIASSGSLPVGAEAPTSLPAHSRPAVTLIQRVQEEEVALARMSEKTAECRQQLAPFTANDDLIESFYYPLFDRPQRRATIAILIKVTAIIQHEIAAHSRGAGQASLPALQRMLVWCQNTIAKLNAPESCTIPPDRLHVRAGLVRFDPETFQVAGQPVSLIGWLDASQHPLHPDILDLDLMACLGARVYAVSSQRPITDTQRQAIRKRASDLGIGFIDRFDGRPIPSAQSQPKPPVGGRQSGVHTTPIAVDLTRYEPDASGPAAFPDAPSSWPQTIPRFYAPSPVAMMKITADTPLQWDSNAIPAVMDRFGDVRLYAGLAWRRAVAGLTGNFAAFAVRWIPASPPGQMIPTPSQWQAALWADLLTGQRIGFLEGWTEPRAEHLLPSESIFLFPELLEVSAHTALQAQQIGPWLAAFPPKTKLAVIAGPSAYDAAQGSWSDEFVEFYRFLLEHQFAPAVCPTAALANRFQLQRFSVLILYNVDGVPAKFAARLGSFHREGLTVVGWGRCLTQDGSNQPLPETSLTASFAPGAKPAELLEYLDQLKANGTIPAGLARISASDQPNLNGIYAQTAPLPDGKLAVAVINWSAAPRQITIAPVSSYRITTYTDVLSGRALPAGAPVPVPPWGVLLLTSHETKSQ